MSSTDRICKHLTEDKFGWLSQEGEDQNSIAEPNKESILAVDQHS